MWRVAVCDSVWIYVEQLTAIIEQWQQNNYLNVQLECFQSGEELLGDIEDNGDYSVIFLDIVLSGIDGLNTAKLIRQRNRSTIIVFVTQYQEYYRQILELRHIYYLEKPITHEKVHSVLDQSLEDCRYLYESYTFRFDRKTYVIRLHEVLYFTSEKRIIRVVLENGKEYVFYGKLDGLENVLSYYLTSFLRIHKSYLVNARQIEQYHVEQIMVKNGQYLPISREKRGKIKKLDA